MTMYGEWRYSAMHSWAEEELYPFTSDKNHVCLSVLCHDVCTFQKFHQKSLFLLPELYCCQLPPWHTWGIPLPCPVVCSCPYSHWCQTGSSLSWSFHLLWGQPMEAGTKNLQTWIKVWKRRKVSADSEKINHSVNTSNSKGFQFPYTKGSEFVLILHAYK